MKPESFIIALGVGMMEMFENLNYAASTQRVSLNNYRTFSKVDLLASSVNESVGARGCIVCQVPRRLTVVDLETSLSLSLSLSSYPTMNTLS